MTEIEWWEYDDAGELANAVAGDIQFVIESALDARGSAVIALAGGKTPFAAYEKLAQAKLDWKKVTIIPGDERIVKLGDPLSNVTALAKIFLPKGARVKPIVPEAMSDYKAKLYAEPKELATRKAGEAALTVVKGELPELVSGSADLTPSNNTLTKNMKIITPSARRSLGPLSASS